MRQKILLKHPQGKKGVNIEIEKYELLKNEIINSLSNDNSLSFGEIVESVQNQFFQNKINFEGSLRWYLEWVKLDLEANQLIYRVPKTSPQKYKTNKHTTLTTK